MKTFRMTLAILALQTLLLGSAHALQNQEKALMEAPPLPPLLTQFEYWSQQYVQWPAATFPVWSIEVSEFVDRDKKDPLYDVVIEDRKGHKRTHYLSDAVLIPKIHEGEVHVTKINVKKISEDPLTFEFSFVDEQKRPVFWRFVQGSEVSARGSGLTQIARQDKRPLMLMYREQGAVAGQGTALQVGQEVSEAEVWKEISAPPFFVAYRGALTVGSEIAVILYGDVDWHVDQAPTSLAVGQKWKLSSKEQWGGKAEEHGGTLEITKIAGSNYTFQFRADSFANSEIVAEATAGGWRVLSLANGTEEHGFAIAFTPGIITSAEGMSNQTFELRMGKSKKVGEGTITTSKSDNGELEWIWRFKSPNWAKARSITQKIKTGSGTMHIDEMIDVDGPPKQSRLLPFPVPETR